MPPEGEAGAPSQSELSHINQSLNAEGLVAQDTDGHPLGSDGGADLYAAFGESIIGEDGAQATQPAPGAEQKPPSDEAAAPPEGEKPPAEAKEGEEKPPAEAKGEEAAADEQPEINADSLIEVADGKNVKMSDLIAAYTKQGEAAAAVNLTPASANPEWQAAIEEARAPVPPEHQQLMQEMQTDRETLSKWQIFAEKVQAGQGIPTYPSGELDNPDSDQYNPKEFARMKTEYDSYNRAVSLLPTQLQTLQAKISNAEQTLAATTTQRAHAAVSKIWADEVKGGKTPEAIIKEAGDYAMQQYSFNEQEVSVINNDPRLISLIRDAQSFRNMVASGKQVVQNARQQKPQAFRVSGGVGKDGAVGDVKNVIPRALEIAQKTGNEDHLADLYGEALLSQGEPI